MEVKQKYEFKIIVGDTTYTIPAYGSTVEEAKKQAIKDVKEVLRQLEA